MEKSALLSRWTITKGDYVPDLEYYDVFFDGIKKKKFTEIVLFSILAVCIFTGIISLCITLFAKS